MDLACHDPGTGIVIVKGRAHGPTGAGRLTWPCLPVATLAEVNPRGVGLQLEGAAEVGGGVACDSHLATALRGKHCLS